MTTFTQYFQRQPAGNKAGVDYYQNIETNLFEKHYTSARQSEKRILSDKQVHALPEYPKDGPHAKEWQVRQGSTQRFLNYANTQLTDHKVILDLGCGNGWFSAKLAALPNARVVAMDINMLELMQAKRIFDQQNLYFCFANLLDKPCLSGSFDVIVMNCMVQYFPDFDEIMQVCLDLLAENGEIHIIDSPFYPENSLAGAQQRSESYYKSIDCEAMSDHYFHHSLEALARYQPDYLYDPKQGDQQPCNLPPSPFIWVKIQKIEPKP
ncbi:Arsenite methyltransferase [BD1-7 clade bacterium]|uniref:Arsenite methyltransferase n=1 Tax=BD1-7 clade bacterium TaxID=2029982 RepID=A0A5S9PA19_9GAMM|nr:Arsenite methyltransferase [BD1-7 clade bacterium]CAA0101352.1 Arsenite methyltransferase [BD1-7 clade bacterium]